MCIHDVSQSSTAHGYINTDNSWDNDGLFVVGLDAGWDAMIVSNADTNKLNHGFAATITAGLSFWIFSLLIEQDFGFIEFAPGVKNNIFEDSIIDGFFNYNLNKQSQKLFKGGTFLVYPYYFEMAVSGTGHLIGDIKLGIGAVYMNTPDYVEKDIEAWFGLRPSASIFYVFNLKPAIGIGAEFDYTLAASESNCFNNERVIHFISLQAKLVFKF